MKTDALKTALNTAFEAMTFTDYDGAAVAPPWIYDNDPTDPPADKAPWIKVAVAVATVNQTSFGEPDANRIRKRGIIQLKVFTELNVGSGLSDHITSEIEESFTSVAPSGLRCRGVTPGAAFRSEEHEGYFQQNISIPFIADRLN